jgi:DNA-binding response OmpR family regulator
MTHMEPQYSIEATMRIMIIDDDQDILNLFNDFLKKKGYDVESYLDPIAALNEIEGRPQEYSLIITDIRMPGISGLELIKRVCEINHDIRVILMSAFEIDGHDLKELEYEKFIQKPIHLRSLAETIDKILEGR